MKSKAEELVSDFVEKSKTTPGQHTVFELADLAYQSGILAGLEMARLQLVSRYKLLDSHPDWYSEARELEAQANFIRAKAKEIREGKA